jgi:acyl carrier protein
LDTKRAVVSILEGVLNLQGRGVKFDLSTPLLGAVPELDSMAVVSVIGALEEKFAFVIDDDEIDGSAFATVGTLVSFVERKLGA